MHFILAGFSHAPSFQMILSGISWEMGILIHIHTTRITSYYFSLVGGYPPTHYRRASEESNYISIGAIVSQETDSLMYRACGGGVRSLTFYLVWKMWRWKTSLSWKTSSALSSIYPPIAVKTIVKSNSVGLIAQSQLLDMV